MKIVRNILIILSALLLAACPQHLVKQLDESVNQQDVPKGTYKPTYLLNKKSLANIYEIYKKPNSSAVSISGLPSAPFYIECLNVNDSRYPDEICCNVLVRDTSGNLIYGLAPPYFRGPGKYTDYWNLLTDSCSGHRESIDSFRVIEFRDQSNRSHAIAFVLDHSPSMGHARALKLQEAVQQVCRSIKRSDLISMVKFTSKIHVEIPLRANDSNLAGEIKTDGLKGKYGMGTAIYTGINEGLNQLSTAPDSYKRVIILFTDGTDNSSKIKPDSIYKLMKRYNVSIYPVAYGIAEVDMMKELAAQTGGRFYQIYSSKEFPYVFHDIYTILNNFYQITYRPPTCYSLHKINIGLNFPGLTLNQINADCYYDKSVFTKSDTIGQITFLDIRFEFAKSEILPESKHLIKKVAEAMERNPKLIIKINGHTDDIGNDEFNMKLSRERAMAVVNELIRLGIDQGRLKSEGFGESRPLVPNDSEVNRSKNRRTEFVILEK